MERIKPKRDYVSPQIEYIELDSEISLVMQSISEEPPTFDNEGEGALFQTPDYFNNDPYKLG